jgi:inorganic pyrophosphatase
MGTERTKYYASFVGNSYDIIIDRPIGYIHRGRIYLVNYGYIPNTIGGDNEEVDVYVLGEFLPTDKCNCKIVGVIQREDDIEDKLIGISNNYNGSYSAEQVAALVEFNERRYKTKVLNVFKN